MQGPQPVLLSRNEIDSRLWDGLIESSVQQNFYPFSWYLDVVSPDWCALVLAGEIGYSVALPIPLAKRWFWRVVEQPLFCQFLGFISRHPLSATEAIDFLSLLLKHFPYISSYAFHPRDFLLVEHIRPCFGSVCFTVLHTHWISLNDYEIVHKRFSPDRRRNIRKGYAMDWMIVRSEDVEPLLTLFLKNHAPMMRDGVDTRLSQILVALAEALREKGLLDLRYAVKNDAIEAGCLFLNMPGTTVYLFNAATNLGRMGNARSVLVGEVIRQLGGSDAIFDFESPEVASIAGFYKSFGAQKVPYIAVRRNSLPAIVQILQRGRGALLRAWRRVRTRPVPF